MTESDDTRGWAHPRAARWIAIVGGIALMLGLLVWWFEGAFPSCPPVEERGTAGLCQRPSDPTP